MSGSIKPSAIFHYYDDYDTPGFMNSNSMDRRILLVDRDDSFAMSLSDQLREIGHNVLRARDGIECLNALRRGVVDLVVLDRDVPWGGGDGVLDACRIERLQLPELIVLTSDRENAAECLPMPGAHVLRKPIEPVAVALCIEALLCKVDWFS